MHDPMSSRNLPSFGGSPALISISQPLHQQRTGIGQMQAQYSASFSRTPVLLGFWLCRDIHVTKGSQTTVIRLYIEMQAKMQFQLFPVVRRWARKGTRHGGV